MVIRSEKALSILLSRGLTSALHFLNARRNSIRASSLAMAGVAVMISAAGQAQAGMITTGFASNNGRTIPNVGHFFDIATGAKQLTVTSIDVNVDDTDSFTLDVYTRVGTSSGFEGSSAGWTLQSSTSATGAGLDNPSAVDVDDFILSASSTVGIYLFFSNNVGINYFTGNIPVSNADLSLTFGSVSEGLFGGPDLAPRTWSGTLYYSVPEPATLALLGLALAGIGFRRRNV